MNSQLKGGTKSAMQAMMIAAPSHAIPRRPDMTSNNKVR
jgi:hypothetical protein